MRRVLYEIYFDAFCKDFKDLTNKIPYFVELGVTSVWLTPFYPSNTQHGYNIQDYTAVNPKYGTLEDFDKFVKTMHDNNLEVILDQVYCHTDYHHEAFQQSIKEINDMYFWSENQIDNRWRICHTNGKYYYAPWDASMPALNLANQDVRQMIEKSVKFWIDRGVDGFRLDAVIHGKNGKSSDNYEFWKWFANMCKSYKEDIYLVAEAWDDYNISHKYGEILGHSFNFEQSGYIKHHINSGEDLVIHNDKKHDVIFLDNHDMSRISHTFNGELDKIKSAIDAAFSFDSDVCLYYMDEINYYDKDTFVYPGGGDDYKVRRKMDWDSVFYQREDKDSLFNYVKSKIKEYVGGN